jgi:predicted unusual protein kinase regulating ubiquinone biosynthesis (AarF/ABC1/UbiB family)
MGRSTSDVFSTISAEPVAAASLGQVYRATLRATGEEVAVKVQRPGIEPIIYQDLVLFRFLAGWLNGYALKNLGTSAQLVLDEFGQKLLEELDYKMEMRNIQVLTRYAGICFELCWPNGEAARMDEHG